MTISHLPIGTNVIITIERDGRHANKPDSTLSVASGPAVIVGGGPGWRKIRWTAGPRQGLNGSVKDSQVVAIQVVA